MNQRDCSVTLLIKVRVFLHHQADIVAWSVKFARGCDYAPRIVQTTIMSCPSFRDVMQQGKAK
jgi:hypothetical protein